MELREFEGGHTALVAGWATSAEEVGLGPVFVRALLGQALDSGHSDVFLRVRPDNLPAIRMYERVGFLRVTDELAAEWNKAQPIAYTWMQYPTGDD
ncbi:FR47-like protein [Kribbella sp. VKM Ac-2527]|uniref:FR47-like protein n=1 Tax=Kribbella caucasensis TaxID=2512215 RepID=A0A4R6KBV7_9ACTN|nr:GNAT family N-acetyltransferase [Kribbella sp. VKM Ac-2527]TDO45796.1 FR47-like protein [Kribbella sp. VKM Ac-2527]